MEVVLSYTAFAFVVNFQRLCRGCVACVMPWEEGAPRNVSFSLDANGLRTDQRSTASWAKLLDTVSNRIHGRINASHVNTAFAPNHSTFSCPELFFGLGGIDESAADWVNNESKAADWFHRSSDWTP
jgi:hypothetical protein